MTKRYKIVRKFAKNHPDEVIKTGLTLEEAREHCGDPETSSFTADGEEARELTRRKGDWMDCYYEE